MQKLTVRVRFCKGCGQPETERPFYRNPLKDTHLLGVSPSLNNANFLRVALGELKFSSNFFHPRSLAPPRRRQLCNRQGFRGFGSSVYRALSHLARQPVPLPHHRRPSPTVSARTFCPGLTAAHDRPTPSRTSPTWRAYLVKGMSTPSKNLLRIRGRPGGSQSIGEPAVKFESDQRGDCCWRAFPP